MENQESNPREGKFLGEGGNPMGLAELSWDEQGFSLMSSLCSDMALNIDDKIRWHLKSSDKNKIVDSSIFCYLETSAKMMKTLKILIQTTYVHTSSIFTESISIKMIGVSNGLRKVISKMHKT